MILSVITINRNNKTGLIETMKSVLSQSFDDMEYIIVDGNSTDGSVEVAEYLLKEPSLTMNVSFVSEPDSGIYNAMNKGVRRSSGRYLLFMNSGDTLCSPNVISDVFSSSNYYEDIIVGHVNFLEDGKVINKDVGYRPEERITLFGLFLFGLPHQGSFIKRDLLLEHPYDEKYKINSDWKFFLQSIIVDNVSLKLISNTIANYDLTGISSKNSELLWNERTEIFHDVVPQRIAEDYEKVFPHYYECKRVSWLLSHRFFYWGYRVWASLGMRLFK